MRLGDQIWELDGGSVKHLGHDSVRLERRQQIQEKAKLTSGKERQREREREREREESFMFKLFVVGFNVFRISTDCQVDATLRAHGHPSCQV